MRNILTTVEHLLPGDTWSSDTTTFVVYNVCPSAEPFMTDVAYVAVRRDRNLTWTNTLVLPNREAFIANRPE